MNMHRTLLRGYWTPNGMVALGDGTRTTLLSYTRHPHLPKEQWLKPLNPGPVQQAKATLD